MKVYYMGVSGFVQDSILFMVYGILAGTMVTRTESAYVFFRAMVRTQAPIDCPHALGKPVRFIASHLLGTQIVGIACQGISSNVCLEQCPFHIFKAGNFPENLIPTSDPRLN